MTEQELKAELHYDPLTGIFTRLKTFRRVKKGDIAGQVHTSTHHPKEHWRIGVRGKYYYAHQLAFLYMKGSFVTEVDHIDQNGLNNSWGNLRAVDHKTNGKNQKKYTSNTSGVTGVTYRKDNKKWRARITVDGKSKSLGCFASFQDAVNARETALTQYNFHPNHGN